MVRKPSFAGVSRRAVKRYTDWRKRPFLKQWNNDHVPIMDWFRENPLGTLVGLFLFYVLINLWTTNLPTNPFAGDANWTGLWSTFYNNTNWFLIVSLPFFGFALIYRMIEEGSGRAVRDIGGISVNVSGFARRLLNAKIGQVKSKAQELQGKVTQENARRSFTGASQSLLSRSRIRSVKNPVQKEMGE